MVYIPAHLSIVIPNVRDNPIPEVGIIHHLLAEQVRKAKQQIVYITLLTIQYRQPQNAVLICDAGSDKLDLCPIHIAQTHIAGSAHISGVGVPLSDDLPKLLFVKCHRLHLKFR